MEHPKIYRAIKLLCVVLEWWIHVIIHLFTPTEGTKIIVNLI